MSKSNHQYEHLLFGSVTETELPALLHRLRGLCDYATSGGVPFADREIGYKIGMPSEVGEVWASLITFCRSRKCCDSYESQAITGCT